MTSQEIFDKIKQQLSNVALEWQQGDAGDSWMLVPVNEIQNVLKYLKDTIGLTYLVNLAGIDYGGPLAVVYVLRSLQTKEQIAVKVLLDRDHPEIPTASFLFGSANWFEREAFDLLGIQFTGHPDLRRILMPEDWVGFPLRKDYQVPAEYHGIPTERPDPHQLLDQLKPIACGSVDSNGSEEGKESGNATAAKEG